MASAEVERAIGVLRARGAFVEVEEIVTGLPALYRIDGGPELTERQMLQRAWDVTGRLPHAGRTWPIRSDLTS